MSAWAERLTPARSVFEMYSYTFPLAIRTRRPRSSVTPVLSVRSQSNRGVAAVGPTYS